MTIYTSESQKHTLLLGHRPSYPQALAHTIQNIPEPGPKTDGGIRTNNTPSTAGPEQLMSRGGIVCQCIVLSGFRVQLGVR